MRSISSKLIIAFMVVSLAGIILISFLALYTTRNEFNKFSFDKNQSNLVTALQDYYQQNNSWSGIETTQLFQPIPLPPQDQPRQDGMLIVTDANGTVVRSDSSTMLGTVFSTTGMMNDIPIEVGGKTVGYMIFNRMPFNENSPEKNFLNRISIILVISAAGTIVIATLLGVLLSRNLTRPIREITAATHAVSEGNFSLQVPVRSKDELGKLATSFNKMSSELSHSLELRRQMTADIAHELRTPLTLIIGHAEAVHDGVIQPSKKTFEIIREESLRLERLVNDLRTLSLADAGELVLNIQPVALDKLISEVVKSFQHPAAQKGIQLHYVASHGLPVISLDGGRIIQVISNVIDNALRHSPKSGKVRIHVEKKKENIQISIQDNGKGVAKKELQNIFNRFYRVDSSRDRDSGGSGLGLAIAKSLVEAHKGCIWAESTPGRGLKVILELPMK
jgi:signal transduction histidine kinase